MAKRERFYLDEDLQTSQGPQTNSLYVSHTDMSPDNIEGGKRANAMRPDADPNNLAGVAKINRSTGQIDHWGSSLLLCADASCAPLASRGLPLREGFLGV